MKKIILIILAIFSLFITFGCKKEEKTKEIKISATVSKDEKYNGVIVAITPDEFIKAGFNLGDSCDVLFSNGYSISDVPYYDGYYVKNEAPVIVSYPGFNDVRITYNNIGSVLKPSLQSSLGAWNKAGLEEEDTVTITLHEAKKYLATQEALSQTYSFDRTDYTTDEEFSNFRALKGGNLKEDFLYRGASPVDNSRGRATITNNILETYQINFIMDLADSNEDIQTYVSKPDFNSTYTLNLINNDQAALLDMSSSFQSSAYQQSVASGVKKMLDNNGPVYIHCMEGKDRTGFVCLLFEALAGATYEEMKNDYMMTYYNYFKVSKEKTSDKYEAIVSLYFDAFMTYLQGTDDLETLKNADYTQSAKEYLMLGGMTSDEVDSFIQYISK